MLEAELKYFDEHRAELLRNYRGMYVVISRDKVLGAFSTIQGAYETGIRQYGLKTFLVKQVKEEGNDGFNFKKD